MPFTTPARRRPSAGAPSSTSYPFWERNEDPDSFHSASSRTHKGQQGRFLGGRKTCLCTSELDIACEVESRQAEWPSVCLLSAETVPLPSAGLTCLWKEPTERGTCFLHSHGDVFLGWGPGAGVEPAGLQPCVGPGAPGPARPLPAAPTAPLYTGVLGQPVLMASKTRSGLGTLSKSKSSQK